MDDFPAPWSGGRLIPCIIHDSRNLLVDGWTHCQDCKKCTRPWQLCVIARAMWLAVKCYFLPLSSSDFRLTTSGRN